MKKSYIVFLFLSLLLVFNCSKQSTSTDTDTENTNTNQSPTSIDKNTNLKDTGTSASDLLSNTDFDTLLLQIAYPSGFKPTTQAVDDLVEYLTERTFKENIEIEYLEVPSPDKESLTLQEIADLELENRTAYNIGKTIAVYIYFSDSPSAEDEPEEDLVTLGAVYRNTSMVMFESTIRDLAGKSVFINDATVETATLLHEFGHLFGLVHIANEMVNPHEGITTDEDGNEIGNQHCNQEGCLMLAELQFGSAMAKMLTAKNGQVPDLDPECLLDLKSYGGR
ncbi:hypothetical protein H0I23_01335 [Cellulophaga sp. HaHaR_3_176]|uniref:hypothetical protein n=1 Tax=Cellulophaga sp. HaHaR_3_176 TaxID=1942464 RepID=UPI001C200B7E|nr:hypothetical protein [Cellulophaga sp. HaHaR_3_176]QWX84325.1 hypothetical protein H0I23_01335 [Cellulophaga sp. HaHaR_3_176]